MTLPRLAAAAALAALAALTLPRLGDAAAAGDVPAPAPVWAAGSVAGTVTDAATGEPLPGANVSVDGTALGTQTTEAGRFTLDGVPAGTVRLRITASGYTAFVQNDVAVADGRTARVDVRLDPAPPERVAERRPADRSGGRDARIESMDVGGPPPPPPPSAPPPPAMMAAPGETGSASARSGRAAPPADAAAAPDEEALPRPRRSSRPGLLTAGDVDDGLNWDAYLGYAQRALAGTQDRTALPDLQLDDRVTLRVVDRAGQPVAGARVRVEATGGSRARRLVTESGTDGRLALFPRYDFGASVRSLRVEATAQGRTESVTLTTLRGDRAAEIRLPVRRAERPRALDLAFVIDATGSMGDELRYLTDEFEHIVGRVEARYPGVDLRFALVAYRDHGDDFVVRRYDFTRSVQTMQQQLSGLRAGGGGDYPEAMDEALESMLGLDWRTGTAARLAFMVADAPPHDENVGRTLDAVREARARGLRLYPLAASGVGDGAEYVMRAAAVLTQGRHLFLTDDSGIGNPHAVPRIPCYSVTALNSLIVRVVAGELEGRRVEADPQEIVREVGQPVNGVCQGRAVTQSGAQRRGGELGYD